MDPALRDVEWHSMWPGLVLAVAGLVLLVCGALHSTTLGTVDEGVAQETQLVMAMTSGGIKYASHVKPPAPPKLEGLANPAEAMRQWNRQLAEFKPPTWKIRVDTAARTPCPT